MTKLNTVTIRNVDKEIYKQFKMKCMERGCSIGSAISEAIELWNQTKR